MAGYRLVYESTDEQAFAIEMVWIPCGFILLGTIGRPVQRVKDRK